MSYLCVLTILLGSGMGDVSTGWSKIGGGLFAQQAPPVFDNATESSQALQPPARPQSPERRAKWQLPAKGGAGARRGSTEPEPRHQVV